LDNFKSQVSTINLPINRNNPQPISISFDNINYSIGQKAKRTIFRCCKPKPRKQILYNISGGFSPGMNAILGKYIYNIDVSINFLQDHRDVENHLY